MAQTYPQSESGRICHCRSQKSCKSRTFDSSMVQVYGDPLAISPASAFEPNFDKHWGDSRKIQQKLNLKFKNTFFLFWPFWFLDCNTQQCSMTKSNFHGWHATIFFAIFRWVNKKIDCIIYLFRIPGVILLYNLTKTFHLP